MTLLATVLVASVLGNLHCAGMCGPLVALAVGMPAGRPGGRWRVHAAYHAGRLLTYALLGAIAGALGAALDLGGALAGVQRGAAIFAGATMITVGLGALLTQLRGPAGVSLTVPGSRGWLARARAAFGGAMTAAHALAAHLQPVPRAATIGLLTTCLPCGWLYAFALTAAGSGSPLVGAAIMTAFWLGTLPALLAIGAGVQTLSRRLGGRVAIGAALLIVAIGVLTVTQRFALPTALATPLAPTAQSPTELSGHVQTLDAAQMPCCNHGG